MTRTRWAFALTLTLALSIWLMTRNSRTVNAAETTSVSTTYSYGENTEEVALDRWATGAPRHWRTLVVKR